MIYRVLPRKQLPAEVGGLAAWAEAWVVMLVGVLAQVEVWAQMA
jgi:hypothetical protein